MNAEYDTTINDTFAMTNMIQGILELVKQEMGIEFDEESLHYERFVTHLKFLAQRLYRHELLKDEEIEFAKLMEGKYPGEYECSKHIAEYIEKELTKRNIKPLRWAVVHVDDKMYTVSVANLKE